MGGLGSRCQTIIEMDTDDVSQKLTKGERFLMALALFKSMTWEREENITGNYVKDRRCPRAYGRSDMA